MCMCDILKPSGIVCLFLKHGKVYLMFSRALGMEERRMHSACIVVVYMYSVYTR